ncbi:MAG: hypothetical protein F4065_11030 [Rhodothermaceae bacterium]|nr:hypothetical protein [Rhodothermaceae bacterium]MXZ57745.1 hypothetical protein [Rhodothermaceae bacterium]MYB91743.1 hypothetical protein [Rhodothermaceae bacterium]MYD67543.1 hypothetical protein [Rhodothermaceae bacterium]MYG45550.1 hypothetical protein [Rhodothermaceae bacterium]
MVLRIEIPLNQAFSKRNLRLLQSKWERYALPGQWSACSEGHRVNRGETLEEKRFYDLTIDEKLDGIHEKLISAFVDDFVHSTRALRRE